MATVEGPIIELSSYEIKASGEEIILQYFVSGLSIASGAAGVIGQMAAAKHAVGLEYGQIIQSGERNTKIIVEAVEVKPVGPTEARVTVRAHGAIDSFEESGITLTQEPSNKDANGKVIQVTDDGGKVKQWLEPIPKMVPVPVKRYRRTEYKDPMEKAQLYVGKVVPPPAGTKLIYDGKSKSTGAWLCTIILGETNNWGKSYEVLYEFAYDQDGWRHAVALRDERGRVMKATNDDILEVSPGTLICQYREEKQNPMSMGIA